MKNSERILVYIKRFTTEKGYPPSVRQIGEGVGLRSTATVHGHLERLKHAGRITWVPGQVRTLRVIG